MADLTHAELLWLEGCVLQLEKGEPGGNGGRETYWQTVQLQDSGQEVSIAHTLLRIRSCQSTSCNRTPCLSESLQAQIISWTVCKCVKLTPLYSKALNTPLHERQHGRMLLRAFSSESSQLECG